MGGRWGGLKVVILPNRDFVEGGPVSGHSHALYLQDGQSTQARPADRALAEKRELRPRPAARGGPMDDDPVSF
jgi:hypothetical protein